MNYADSETQKKLIDACNLLHEFIGNKLPDEWEVALTINNKESSISLINPSLEEVQFDADGNGISAIDEACVVAIERELDTEDQRWLRE